MDCCSVSVMSDCTTPLTPTYPSFSVLHTVSQLLKLYHWSVTPKYLTLRPLLLLPSMPHNIKMFSNGAYIEWLNYQSSI